MTEQIHHSPHILCNQVQQFGKHDQRNLSALQELQGIPVTINEKLTTSSLHLTRKLCGFGLLINTEKH